MPAIAFVRDEGLDDQAVGAPGTEIKLRARERLGHYFAHYNHFRPHQGIQGLVPADRFFGAEDVLRKSLEARMERDELGAALSETPRKSVYVFGQIGDQQVSLHGDK